MRKKFKETRKKKRLKDALLTPAVLFPCKNLPVKVVLAVEKKFC